MVKMEGEELHGVCSNAVRFSCVRPFIPHTLLMAQLQLLPLKEEVAFSVSQTCLVNTNGHVWIHVPQFLVQIQNQICKFNDMSNPEQLLTPQRPLCPCESLTSRGDPQEQMNEAFRFSQSILEHFESMIVLIKMNSNIKMKQTNQKIIIN